MYLPRHFEENRTEVLHQLIVTHPLGALVSLSADGLNANHIPFQLVAEPTPLGTLRGHVARANPLWRDFDPRVEALVIFQGPGAYVSPSWYPSKAQDGRVVPTWNYVAVPAYGRLRVVEEPEWLRAQLEALTEQHEAKRAEPWRVADAPAEFRERLLGAIVGIEIEITRLLGKRKLSQNRPAADRQGVIAGLGAEADAAAAALAAAMANEPAPGGDD
jgi:transcriptional regulator